MATAATARTTAIWLAAVGASGTIRGRGVVVEVCIRQIRERAGRSMKRRVGAHGQGSVDRVGALTGRVFQPAAGLGIWTVSLESAERAWVIFGVERSILLVWPISNVYRNSGGRLKYRSGAKP